MLIGISAAVWRMLQPICRRPPDWLCITTPYRHGRTRAQAVSPEMRGVIAIDHDIGQLLQLLDERDLARRTVIVGVGPWMIPNDGRPIEPELPESLRL